MIHTPRACVLNRSCGVHPTSFPRFPFPPADRLCSGEHLVESAVPNGLASTDGVSGTRVALCTQAGGDNVVEPVTASHQHVSLARASLPFLRACQKRARAWEYIALPLREPPLAPHWCTQTPGETAGIPLPLPCQPLRSRTARSSCGDTWRSPHCSSRLEHAGLPRVARTCASADAMCFSAAP